MAAAVVVTYKEDSNNLTNLNEWALESSYCSLERAYFHAQASLKSHQFCSSLSFDLMHMVFILNSDVTLFETSYVKLLI